MFKSTDDQQAAKEPPSPNGCQNSSEKLMVETRRQYLREQRRQRFIQLNPLAWFLDEFPPQEMYRSFGNERNTRQELRYRWLRQRTGWTFLSHLKTSAGARFAAAAGLVSAVFQGAPMLHQQGGPAMSFRWLFFAGIFYLTAVVWHELCCPLLLKQSLFKKPGSLGHYGRRWLQALVEDELRRWWKKREWRPRAWQLDTSRAEDKTIAVVMNGYGTPAYAGFGPYARAHIDLALEEFSEVAKVNVWEEATQRNSDDPRLRKLSAAYSYEGSRPLVEQLHIRQPDSYEREEQPEVLEDDIIISWCQSPLELSHEVPSKRDIYISHDAEGMRHLFCSDERAIAFSEIVARWQDSLHPFRRLVLLGLYGLSLTCFAWFVVTQSALLIQDMTVLIGV